MSTEDTQDPVAPPSSAKKKRNYKDLPLELRDVGPQSIGTIVCALELDSKTDKEELRAQKIVCGDSEISLSSLNADQLRQLCRKLGITGASSAKRDQCRKLIAVLQQINTQATTRGEDPRSIEQRAINTILRQVNIVFTSEFIDRFQELNDAKQRADYESGNTLKQFWTDVTLSYNEFEEQGNVNASQLTQQADLWDDVSRVTFDVSSNAAMAQTAEDIIDCLDTYVNLPLSNTKIAIGQILLQNSTNGLEATVRAIISKFGMRSMGDNNDNKEEQQRASSIIMGEDSTIDEKTEIVNKFHDCNIQEMMDSGNCNLTDVDVMTPEVYRKRIHLLFRVRQKMKDNMTVSGTHDNNPWNFVDAAMNSLTGGRRLSKIGVLYFYRRCEEYPGIDAAFQSFLDESLKGCTVSLGSEQESRDEELKQVNKKAKLDKSRNEAFTSIKAIASNSQNIYSELKRTNNVQEQLEFLRFELEAAKALGDPDRIRELIAEVGELKKQNSKKED